MNDGCWAGASCHREPLRVLLSHVHLALPIVLLFDTNQQQLRAGHESHT